jgi:flagellar protein FliL
MVTLEQFTVNLSTPGSVNPKFVRVNISLEVPTEDAEAEVTTKLPQVRNAIIDLFNSKRPADLATAEGRDYLKEEIRNALNGFLVNGKVRGVYFTNFALSS